MVGEVFQGFFDELWDRWWLGQVISGGLEAVLVGDVAESDVLAFGGGVWEATLSLLMS